MAAQQRRDDKGEVQVELIWCSEAEDLAAGRFFAFMCDEARAHQLF
jgi:hypothetical protein